MKINKTSISLAMIKAGIANQKELALKAGLSENTVSLLMRGATVAVETIGKIAAALGVNPVDIVRAD